jgi:hypothetical protein
LWLASYVKCVQSTPSVYIGICSSGITKHIIVSALEKVIVTVSFVIRIPESKTIIKIKLMCKQLRIPCRTNRCVAECFEIKIYVVTCRKFLPQELHCICSPYSQFIAARDWISLSVWILYDFILQENFISTLEQNFIYFILRRNWIVCPRIIYSRNTYCFEWMERKRSN